MKLANRATAAITAEPMAKPLVTALVVLPTASRLTMIRSGSPWNSPDISAMPAALSLTGPKVSSETITPVAASMPMPVEGDQVQRERQVAAAQRQRDGEGDGDRDDGVHRASRPVAVPDSTTVAGPVSADSAISWTGPYSVPV